MIYLLGTLVIALNIVDILQTRKLFITYGAEGEVNFLLKNIYRKWEFTGFIVFKLSLITFAIFMALFAKSIFVMSILLCMYIFAVLYNWDVIRKDDNIK